MAIDKIFNDGNVDGIADNIFNAVNNSVSEVKQMQQRKAAENAQMVVQSLKKIDTDIRSKFDNVTNTLEKRIITIKDGRDGIDGKDGRDGKNGKDGRDGKDGKQGIQGPKGQDGLDGLDGISVANANIDFDGSLIIALSDGREINVGEVVSSDLADKIQVISTMSTNGAVGIKDEGSSISTGVKNINFVGAAITATNSGDDVTVNVSAGTGTVTSVGLSGGTTGLTVTGSPITTSGTITLAGTLAVANGGTGVTTSTGTGNTVLSTSPTLVTPILGTPTSATLTNATGLPLSTGVTGTLPVANGGTGITSFGTGVATFLGTPSSSNFAAAVTDETGSGALVFATSPTLVTPILGTPTSGTLTNATGLPISTGVSGLGTGVATALAVNVGSAGAPVVNGGALGTPSSGTVTNLTGTASININGTVGATTASSGAFTTLSATGVTTVQAGTAALPAITTTGDTNTGIFFPAADTIAFAEGGAESMRIDSSGNLGIGITSPSYRLDVKGATGENATLAQFASGTNTGRGLTLGLSAGGTAVNDAFVVYNSTVAGGYAGHIWQAAGTERARIDASGNLLVGKTSATTSSKLEVDASSNVAQFYHTNSSDTIGIYMRHGRGLSGFAGKMISFRRNDDTEVGSIVLGDSSTSYNTSSDYRLKNTIAPMTGALAKVALLKPCTYKWNSSGSDGQGFIAHELAEVFPDCVTGEKDAVDADGKIKPQGIDVSFLVATLTAALQELDTKFEAYKASHP